MAYIDFHPTIHKMGDEACAAAIIEGSILELTDYTVTTTGSYVLAKIPQMGKVSFPMCKVAAISMLQDNTALTSVYFPRMTAAEYYMFGKCVALRKAHFPAAQRIVELAFSESGLDTLVLSSKRYITNLAAVNVFTGTPIEEGNGYIYVPKKMEDGRSGIAAYESATNWSSFAGQFRYIEDYPEILAFVKEQTPWY